MTNPGAQWTARPTKLTAPPVACVATQGSQDRFVPLIHKHRLAQQNCPTAKQLNYWHKPNSVSILLHSPSNVLTCTNLLICKRFCSRAVPKNFFKKMPDIGLLCICNCGKPYSMSTRRGLSGPESVQVVQRLALTNEPPGKNRRSLAGCTQAV